MCDVAVWMEPLSLAYVPNCLKTLKMCDKAVRKKHLSLLFAPDWFVTQQQVKYLRDDNDDWYDNKLIECYEGYQKRKAQKAKIKEEFLRIVWHPSRWWDWCIPEDEKKGTAKLWK